MTYSSATTHISTHHTHRLIHHHTHRPAVSLFKPAFEWTCSLGNSPYHTSRSESQLDAFSWGETWSTVLFFLALSQAAVSHYKALLMSRGGTENKSLLDLQTWITAMNQSGRHCSRTSEVRQPAPSPQLPWFPAPSSKPAFARLPVGLNSGVRTERSESQL